MVASKIYHSRIGAPFVEEDAQAIGNFVYSIKNASTEDILEKIKKNKNHPIAKYVEWDDKIASERFRLQQVRNIVNHITIEIVEVGERIPMRAFHSIQYPEAERRVYVSYDAVLSDDFALDQIVSRARAELNNWVERYQQYSALQTYVVHIKSAFAEDQSVASKKGIVAIV